MEPKRDIAFAVLGSGSSGNCTVVRLGAGDECRHLLLDAGFSPRETERRLGGLGVEIDEPRDILLTHLDNDHFHRGWGPLLDEMDVRVHVHRRHQRRATNAGVPGRLLEVFDDDFDLDADTRVEVALVAHDAVGTAAYVIDRGGCRLGLATDLGRVTRGLLERFVDLHALAIESNYDPTLQRTSDRPDFLKARIMGGQGHLSNEQTLQAVVDIAERSRLRQVALLHLSRQCNDPSIIKRLYAQRAPELLDILTVTTQSMPTAMLAVNGNPRARRGEQLGLF